MTPNITHVRTPEHLQHIRTLFTEYANWLADDRGISLAFQGFEQELATLPGKYAQPSGDLFLIQENDTAIGCIGYRKWDATTCEIKRLYVAHAGRGQRLGEKLVAHCLNAAKSAGYTKAVLDTGQWMTGAQKLYESFGFADIPRYYDNPFPDIRYMGADL
ncbi:MAG: GNAT family N-acetyltransferase [Paracoccaceae bacterium]